MVENEEEIEEGMAFTVTFPEQTPIEIRVPDYIVERGRGTVRDYIEWALARKWAKAKGAKEEGRAASNWYLSHDMRIDHYIEELEEVPETEEEELSPEAENKTDVETYLDGAGGNYKYVVYYQQKKSI